MKFSIIIPIYNVEKYLNECIDSVLIQDFRNYEIILVNDGSPDNCGEICDEYANKYPQVKVIHKENGGLSDARNFGIKEAKGDYLIFLDSDDYWKGANILSDLQTITDNGNPDIIIYGRTYVFENGHFQESPILNPHKSNDFVSDYGNLVKSGIYNPSACNKIIRRSLVCDNYLQFPKRLLHEDVAWSFDVAQYTKVYSIYENPFYQCRCERVDSITNIIKDKNLISYLDICSDKTKYLLKNQKNIYSKGNLDYLASIYLCVFRDYYNKLTQEHQKSAKKHLYKMRKIDTIYKNWFINYLRSKKFKLLIQLFGIQRGMYLINLYYKYIYRKKLEI